MTFYIARAKLVLPGDDWFRQVVEARRKLHGMPKIERIETPNIELCCLLDNMEGVSLLDLDGIMIEEITLTFLHYNEATGVLVLSVDFEKSESTTECTIPFDRLFKGQYDPEEVRLTQEDTPYVIAHVTLEGAVQGNVHVVQPVHERDVPYGVCAASPVPPEFVEQLLALVA